jgi:hypothetical protein
VIKLTLKFDETLMKKHLDKTQFGNLAMLYYPDKAYKTALRLLRREFELTSGLLPALEAVGYRQNQRVISPRAVKVIENFLGEMD